MNHKARDPKRCTRCGELKPRTAFYKHATARGGVHSQCVPCATISAAKRQRENKAAVKIVNRRAKLKKAYGLTLEAYQALLDGQNGVCAICSTPTPGGRGAFTVDHCHTSGAIRGLLCNACNVGIGALKDNPDVLMRAVDYLTRRRTP